MDTALAWVGLLGGLLGGLAAIYTALRFRSIEDYRAKLKAEGYEHEVRFARLHERRIEVIADLHSAILDAERAFHDWTHPLHFVGQPSKDELAKEAVRAGKALRDRIRRSRIWLDEDLSAEVSALEEKLHHAWYRLSTADPEQQSQVMTGWMEAWKSASEEVPRILAEIERRFRELLGIRSTRA